MLYPVESYQQVINGLPIAICIIDGDGRIVALNERACETWGDRPAIGSLYEAKVRVLAPDNRVFWDGVAPAMSVLRSGRGVENVEVNVRRPDGVVVPVLTTVSPLRNEAGQVSGAIEVFQDISDRKRLEQASRVAERMNVARQVATSFADQMRSPIVSLTTLLETLQSHESVSSETRARADAVQQHLKVFENLARQMKQLFTPALNSSAEA